MPLVERENHSPVVGEKRRTIADTIGNKTIFEHTRSSVGQLASQNPHSPLLELVHPDGSGGYRYGVGIQESQFMQSVYIGGKNGYKVVDEQKLLDAIRSELDKL